MFLQDPNMAAEVGLLLRAIMYAILFIGMAHVVWNATDSSFGPNLKPRTIKALAVVCLIVGILNVFMAVEWLIIYFI